MASYLATVSMLRGTRVVVSAGSVSPASETEVGSAATISSVHAGQSVDVVTLIPGRDIPLRVVGPVAPGSQIFAAPNGLSASEGTILVGVAESGPVAGVATITVHDDDSTSAAKLTGFGISPTSVSASDIGALGTRLTNAETAIVALQNALAGDTVVVPVAASTINLDSGDIFTKTLSANTTLTVSGGREGITYRVAITNPSSHTLAWLGVIWPGATPTQSTGGKVDVYDIFVSAGQHLARRVDAGWSVDSTKPTYVSGTISADGLTFTPTWSELIQQPTMAGITLTASGGAVTLTAPADITSVATPMTLSRAILSTETVTVSIAANAVLDLTGNGILAVSGGTVLNGSTAGTSEGFESATVSSGWALLSGGTWNDTTSPIVGNSSLKATGASGSSSLKGAQYTGTFPDNATGWEISGILKISTAPSTSVNFCDILLPDGSTVQNKLRVNASLGFGAYNGSDAGQTVISAFTASLNTPVYFWITRPAGGTGIELRLSTDSNRPSTANYTATGTNIGTAGSFRLTSAQGGVVFFDQIRLPH